MIALEIIATAAAVLSALIALVRELREWRLRRKEKEAAKK